MAKNWEHNIETMTSQEITPGLENAMYSLTGFWYTGSRRKNWNCFCFEQAHIQIFSDSNML